MGPNCVVGMLRGDRPDLARVADAGLLSLAELPVGRLGLTRRGLCRLGAAQRKMGARRLEVVQRDEGQHSFGVLPKRWIVERTLDW
jgi:hypothetical protein